MTTELTIRDADNGMMVEGEEFVQVIENTHTIKGVGKENLIYELGKIFYSELNYAMEQEISNNVKVKIEITKID